MAVSSSKTCHRQPRASADLQNEDDEADSDGAAAPRDGHEVHDQDAGPETGLRGVHDQERAWLERVTEEEHDRKEIDKQDDDDQEHEDDDGAGTRVSCAMGRIGAIGANGDVPNLGSYLLVVVM